MPVPAPASARAPARRVRRRRRRARARRCRAPARPPPGRAARARRRGRAGPVRDRAAAAAAGRCSGRAARAASPPGCAARPRSRARAAADGCRGRARPRRRSPAPAPLRRGGRRACRVRARGSRLRPRSRRSPGCWRRSRPRCPRPRRRRAGRGARPGAGRSRSCRRPSGRPGRGWGRWYSSGQGIAARAPLLQGARYHSGMALRLAVAQFDFPVGDGAGNARRIAALVAAPAEVRALPAMMGEAGDGDGGRRFLFPALAPSGYTPEDLLPRPSFLADCEAALAAIARAETGIVAVVGWPEAAGSVVYNSASVLRDGRIEATYRKRELPNYAVFDERRYFAVDPDGGPCVFDVDGVRVGVVVCEDLWFPEPLSDCVDEGAELVLVPNASPFVHDKHAQRDALLA